MKKRLQTILVALLVLISFSNTGVSVQAATHTHTYVLARTTIIGDGYNSSGHYYKITSYFACSCGSVIENSSTKFESHSISHTDSHNGTRHSYGDSCGICGWSNVTTYPCPGGNGGICIYPY